MAEALDDLELLEASGLPWDETRPGTRVDFALARAEFAGRQLAHAAADQMAAIVDVLDEAWRHPEIYVPLEGEPTARQLDLAAEAATADLAMRLSVAEGTVATLARQARALRSRAPRVWAMLHDGLVSAANARRVADTLESLPPDADADATLDATAAELAPLAPARFRERLRAARERVHPRPLAERHADAAAGRRAWREADVDGMAWLGMHLRAADAETAWERIDGAARHLAGRADESRTLDQLRADVAADILTGRLDPATAPRVTVGVLIPMMSLLGLGEEPATLDGYGPIDAETARRLTGHAPSFHRILTHPVSGTMLDVDRRSYRPPTDLKRWLAIRDGTCRFPGCGRGARHCDVDHTTAWARGGTTSSRNLAHLSPRHHTLKDETRWRMRQARDGTITWTSPTGAIRTADPPPF